MGRLRNTGIRLYFFFLEDLFIFYLTGMSMILPVCLFVFHVHPWCLWRSQEATGPLELELLNGSERPCGCWKPGPLKEQLTSRPSLQPWGRSLKSRQQGWRALGGLRQNTQRNAGTKTSALQKTRVYVWKPLLYYTDRKRPSVGQEHHAPCLPSVSWQSRGLLCSLTDRTHFCRDFPETETPLNVHHVFNTLLLCGCYGLEPVSEEIMAKMAHKLFQQRNTLGCVSGPAWHLKKHFGFFSLFQLFFPQPQDQCQA